MYWVQLDTQKNHLDITKKQVFLIGNLDNTEPFSNLGIPIHNPDAQYDDYALYLATLSDFARYSCSNVLITPDSTLEELTDFFKNNIDHVINAVIFVFDFKDGRTFSLIRHIRHLGYTDNIIVAGNYGLDQAAYYYKSGASGFLVQEHQLDTIKKTLDDLKSGHLGISAHSLPMFQ